MEIQEEVFNKFKEEIKNCKSIQELLGDTGPFQFLKKKVIETLLEAELTEYLGYERYDRINKNTSNSRNGKSSKRLKSKSGEIEIEVPRDRNGEFEPILVQRYQKDIGEIEDKIICLYAKGMSTRDIAEHIREIYGIEVSPMYISNATDKVSDLVREWQSRPLEDMYIIVYFDALFYKVRDSHDVSNKAAYTCLGINKYGKKEILGIWIAESEGANFWLSILSELKNRGVKDILIASVDGLNGFPEAINSIFPKTEVQSCIIHQIRNSLKYITVKDKMEFMKDLKMVYKAPTEELGLYELERLSEKWSNKYPIVINSWKNKWVNLSTYFKYSEEIRKLIYTTNIIEGVHRQFRKVTKNKSIFPNDDALKKILYLAIRDIEKKWTKPVKNWSIVLSQFIIIFKDRIKIEL